MLFPAIVFLSRMLSLLSGIYGIIALRNFRITLQHLLLHFPGFNCRDQFFFRKYSIAVKKYEKIIIVLTYGSNIFDIHSHTHFLVAVPTALYLTL